MTFRKKLLATGLAGLTLIATAAAAMAAPAIATGNVNVRSGPGTNFSVVDQLRRGERVEVVQCQGSWCYVEKRGQDGWVSSTYLGNVGRPGWNDDSWTPRPPPRPPVYQPPRPPVYQPSPRPPQWNPGPQRPPHWNNPRPQPVYPYPVYPSEPRADFCYSGPNSYFCLGN